MKLLETKRKELTELLEHKEKLEAEIQELEQKIEHEPERLKNYSACLNPILYVGYSCGSCNFYKACDYNNKCHYDRVMKGGRVK